MGAVHLCVLILGVGLVPFDMFGPTSIFLLTDPERCLLWILLVTYDSRLSYYTVVSVLCGRLLGVGAGLLVLLCVMFSRVFVTFPFGVSGQGGT